MFNSIN